MTAKPRACCPMLPMALDRARPTDKAGLERGWVLGSRTLLNDAVVLRVRKDRDRSAQWADTVLFAVNFCPFCGTRLPATASKRRGA